MPGYHKGYQCVRGWSYYNLVPNRTVNFRQKIPAKKYRCTVRLSVHLFIKDVKQFYLSSEF